jgi:hypothetical protein
MLTYRVRLKVCLGDTGASSPYVARLLYPSEVQMIIQRIFEETIQPVDTARFTDWVWEGAEMGKPFLSRWTTK